MKLADVEHYQYELPESLIRKTPLEPRDSARLFVYDTQTNTVTLDVFREVAKYLPESALMVLNDTRVWPARLWLKKPTGGKIEVLLLVNEWDGVGPIPGVVDRKASVGDALAFPDGSQLVAERQEEEKFFFSLESARPLETLMQEFGTTPIPHYLEGGEEPGESALRERYQTIFAAAGASVAAPTASLHFTDRVFKSLAERHIETAPLTLNVGRGTFAPLRDEHFAKQKLHAESVSIPEATLRQLEQAKHQSQPVIAVGTTTMRTLEAWAQAGRPATFYQAVDIFIQPPYTFQVADIIITNFHLPKTSLMLLVDAFLQHKGAQRGLVDLYSEAIREKFAFYSFGDSMLIR